MHAASVHRRGVVLYRVVIIIIIIIMDDVGLCLYRTTTQQIYLRGEEARKTIEDMHAVWTMENEEAHDA